MAKIYWYYLPGWTPRQAAWRVYEYIRSTGEGRVEFMQPATIVLKRGALILWEGEARITALQHGDYIGFRLEASGRRSFLTGGIIGRRQAKKAEEALARYVEASMGQPVQVSEV